MRVNEEKNNHKKSHNTSTNYILKSNFYKTVIGRDSKREERDPGTRMLPRVFSDEYTYTTSWRYLLLLDIQTQLANCKLFGMKQETIRLDRIWFGGPDEYLMASVSMRKGSYPRYKHGDLFLIRNMKKAYDLDISSEMYSLVCLLYTTEMAPKKTNDNNNKNLDLIIFTFVFQIATPVDTNHDNSAITRSVTDDTIKCGHDNNWFLTYITFITTWDRELDALNMFDNCYLKYEIMGTLLYNNNKETLTKSGKQVLSNLQRSMNQSQLYAIQKVSTQTGISLIQGPPGTGKTTTIVGLIAVLLANSRGSNNLRSIRHQGDALGLYSCHSKDISDESTTMSLISNGKYKRNNGMFSKKELYYTRSSTEMKVFVCAPSNAAVDEVARRVLRDGLVAPDGLRQGIVCGRTGFKIDTSLLSMSVEYNARVIAIKNKLSIIRHPKLLEKGIDVQVNQLAEMMFRGCLKKSELRVEIEKFSKASIEIALTGDISRIRMELLANCDVIFSSLCGSGSASVFDLMQEVDVVIIDEATQGTEIATLIPLVSKIQKAVLVGDHKQLPSIVFSTFAKKCGYERSLFERLLLNDHPMHFLDVQYRMHPSISLFPRKIFYSNKLKDSSNILEYVGSSEWSSNPILSNCVFFDVPGIHIKSGEHTSISNENEAVFVTELIRQLIIRYPTQDWVNTLAVITPYTNQVTLLKKKISALCAELSLSGFLVTKNIKESVNMREHITPPYVETEDFIVDFHSREERDTIIEKQKVEQKQKVEYFKDEDMFEMSQETERGIWVRDTSDCPFEVSTISSFQGREKRVIILSCVRANIKQGLGFIADLRRMNVALTRAKENLWVIGRRDLLEEGDTWRKFIEYCSFINSVYKVDPSRIGSFFCEHLGSDPHVAMKKRFTLHKKKLCVLTQRAGR